MNNGINYQPQLVSLPDFWTINNRIGILCGKDLPNAMTAAEANDLAVACQSPMDFCDGFVSTTGPWSCWWSQHFWSLLYWKKYDLQEPFQQIILKFLKFVIDDLSFSYTKNPRFFGTHPLDDSDTVPFFVSWVKQKYPILSKQVTEKLGLHNLRDLDDAHFKKPFGFL